MFSWRRCALFRREVRDLRAYIHTTELILMRKLQSSETTHNLRKMHTACQPRPSNRYSASAGPVGERSMRIELGRSRDTSCIARRMF